jgi:hypothetical protein
MIEEMKKRKEEFSTLDLYLAAYLTQKGVDSRPEVLGNGKVVFVFSKEEADSLMDEYAVSLEHKFAREVKNLRGIMNKMRKG